METLPLLSHASPAAVIAYRRGAAVTAQRFLSDAFETPNARSIRDRTFNLYLNENYGLAEAEDVVAAILKVESAYAA